MDIEEASDVEGAAPPKRTETLLESTLGAGVIATAEYDPSQFTAPSNREVPRSLISSGVLPEPSRRTEAPVAAGGVKRTQNESPIHSRLKKKKSFQPPALETRASTLLQTMVPKLGPVLRVKPKDSEQLKKATQGIVFGNKQSVAHALNFLMGWSLADKGRSSSEEVLDVVNALLDFVVGVFIQLPQSATEHLEAAQSSELVPDEMKQCMAASLILKNISVTPLRPAEMESVSTKLSRVAFCVLTGKLFSEASESVPSVHVDDIPYSLTRDVLYLLKTVPSLGEMETQVLTELVRTVCNRDHPLRLRTLALDVLSAFLCQPGIKDSLLSLLESVQSELLMHLKILMLLPMESAVREAEFEFEGGLEYDEVAIFTDKEQAQWKEEVKLWAWRLQAEALLSGTSFLTALMCTEGFEAFASDDCILQVLADLTTGKKIMDMVQGDRSMLDSKHEVMGTMRRHVRSSEVQAYRIIQDILQDEESAPRKKLLAFEDQFVLSAFDNTWQARQCAIVLSLMRGRPDTDAVAILASLKRVHEDLNS